MKLGSREADEAYDRWHDRMADEYFGANEDDACEIFGGDQDAMNELTADAERFRALRELSARYAARYAEGKTAGIEVEDVVTDDLPSVAGIVIVLGADDFTAAIDELMRANVQIEATDAALSRQVACTDGLGVAVPPAPTFGKDET